jgi:hypothetical protein
MITATRQSWLVQIGAQVTLYPSATAVHATRTRPGPTPRDRHEWCWPGRLSGVAFLARREVPPRGQLPRKTDIPGLHLNDHLMADLVAASLDRKPDQSQRRRMMTCGPLLRGLRGDGTLVAVALPRGHRRCGKHTGKTHLNPRRQRSWPSRRQRTLHRRRRLVGEGLGHGTRLDHQTGGCPSTHGTQFVHRIGTYVPGLSPLMGGRDHQFQGGSPRGLRRSAACSSRRARHTHYLYTSR